MIITQTPYRISMFGGGSDHPKWFENHEGSVVSFAIDKYCYLSLRELPPYFNHNFRVVYSKVETVKEIEEIRHPAVREAFKKYGSGVNFELQHHGDLPARSGVGSSSAFAVGLINALKLMRGENLSSIQLANEAIQFEQVDLKETVGSQDQVACAVGGLNYIKFNKTGWTHKPINVSDEYLGAFQKNIILVYSGISRMSSDLSKSLVENLGKKENLMFRNISMSLDFADLVSNEGDLSLVGDMLKESWVLKKQLNPMAITLKLEEFYDLGLASGADGGKILGAGGGGFFLFWVKPENQARFTAAMTEFIIAPVRISKTGSRKVV
jgi:D-glycero-alpha-D-manno-heptose-7-phosphate kinase